MQKKETRVRKKKRERLVALLFFLPFRWRVKVDNWLRGRKEYREVKRADFVIVSPPKCGRTWVRVMLSRFYQLKYNLPESELLGYDNLHQLNPAIPRIRFTHDRYISDYTGNRDSKRDFYDRKVILLVRDPRDVAASNYFQWKNTVNPFKRKLRNVPDDPDAVNLYEYAMTPELGIPRTIRFLNGWAEELAKVKSHLLVRYEDMRVQPQRVLQDILSFLEEDATAQQVAEVVDYASFSNMQKLEQGRTFDTGSRRLMVKDPGNPEASKVRRGKVGGYRDYFSAAQLQEVDHLVETELAAMFGYRGAEQQLPEKQAAKKNPT